MRCVGQHGTPRRDRWIGRVGILLLLSFCRTLRLSGGELTLQVPELPKEPGKSVIFDLPGLPSGAKPLELVLVPGSSSVKPFFMGKYEVTQGQYEAVTHTNPAFYKKGPDYPVDRVNWYDAQEFCRRLTASLSAKPNGQFRFRLPTDAEWSVAVGLPEESGNTPKEKDSKIKDVYPWGTQWPPPKGAGNYYPSLKVDSFDTASPVGSFKPNQYGLYDLGGNVWEWCEDWYDQNQKHRVVRGASWGDLGPNYLLSSFHNCFIPDGRNGDIGFRVVLEVVESVR